MSRRRGDTSSIYEAMNPVKITNNLLERMYLRLFGELATNRFHWEGLPEGIDPRFVELTLYMRGLSVFFKSGALKNPTRPDKYNAFMALRGSGAGALDMYDNYMTYIVYGNSMISGTLDQDDCVPIWGNTLRVPDYDVVTTYAHRLTTFDRSIDNTVILLRTPYVIAVDQSQRLSVINMMRQVEEGQPFIVGTPQAMQTIQEQMAVWPTGVTGQTLHDLQIGKTRVWNEAMTFLGINNANQEKKERVVTDEVAANNSQVEGFRNSALAARQLAVERINEKYGLNITVEWNESVNQLLTDAPALGQDVIEDNDQHSQDYRK